MFNTVIDTLAAAKRIVVIQAENPDGDSLGSSLALEEILGDLGKEVILYCAIEIPKYLRYVKGWDRVTYEWPNNADAAIIVDTSSSTLLVKTFQVRGLLSFLESHPVIVLDHHKDMESDMPFDHEFIAHPAAVSTSEVIYEMTQQAGWTVNAQAAEHMLIAMLSDSLGLTTPNTAAESYQVAADLVKLGAVPSVIENRRREFMKKPAEILEYKGRLIERIEYSLDGKLASVHIPWDEIEKYSDKYNPSVLVIDEMRLVEGVEVAIALKTYPDGKITGKLRANVPVAQAIAGYFGGGGHKYSAGFKLYESYDKVMSELIDATHKALAELEKETEKDGEVA